MLRRQFLATTALLTVPLAGCAHPPNVLDMREATDDTLADEMSRTVSPESDGYEVMRDAIGNESATVAGTSPPIDPAATMRFRDRYYEVAATEVGSRERTRHDIRIDYNPETSEAGETIEYADLPAVDKEALDGLIPPERDPPEQDGFEIGTTHLYPEHATERSVLVPTQQYEFVRYQGETYRIQVTDGTVTEVTYRYEVTEIAASTAVFASQLRATYQFELSELSAAEREVVETAIESGYLEEADEAFRSVIARLRAHEGLETSDAYGTWLVAYQGAPYIAYAEFPPDVTPASP